MVDILVTGAAGFVGGALRRRLESTGRAAAGLDLRGAVAFTADITDPQALTEAFRAAAPRVVVHAAARVDDRGTEAEFWRVNVEGTRHALAAARAVGVQRFVQISSIAALGVAPPGESDEHTPLALDAGGYFGTKAISERLVREAEGPPERVVVRPGDVFGPGSVPWVERPLALMRRHTPVLVGGGRGLIAHTWIENLLDGLVLAIDHPAAPGGVFTVTDGVQTTTCRDYFARLARAARLRPPRVSVPVPVALLTARLGARLGVPVPFTASAVTYLARRSTYRIDAATRVLGYRPRVGLDAAMAALSGAF